MASTIKSLPLSPAVTGLALYLLTRSPPLIRQPILERALSLLSPKNLSRLVTTLKYLFAASLIKNANTYLNHWANNNFHLFGTTKDWDFNKELAIVTGGCSGFGALFATDLSAHGIRVAVLDITPLPATLASNPKISFYICDVTSPSAVQAAATKIISELGHPSILINNAGIGAGKSILDTTPQFLQKIFNVNLLSHWYTTQAFLPHMLEKRKGHIVSIASMASFVSAPHIVDYSATKSGALAFHEGLASELRLLHHCPEIKTTVVHPIWADTPLIAEGKAHLQKTGQLIIDPQIVSDAVVKQILGGRSGQIILAGAAGGVISALRGLPVWISAALLRVAAVGPPPSPAFVERKSG
ncbi:hypothetical protein BDV97DRAFT_352169 [Delphinella strobiligena]|nr:hypothetical protein BDV97DRAFT_352169 [Delphinella strobiligena]